MKKGYMIREGNFYADWVIEEMIVFPTKVALKEYFKYTNGFQCYRSKKTCYGKDEEMYENQNEQYGYEIITVEVRL